MAIVLITGMSGTGKTTVLEELARRGHRTVETDEPGWIEEVWQGGTLERLWIPEKITALLDSHSAGHLFIQGTVPNQGVFYPRFDAIVLLGAPLETMLERIATRTNNPFGKSAEERYRIVQDRAEIEPILRARATHQINTGHLSNRQVADCLEKIARDAET